MYKKTEVEARVQFFNYTVVSQRECVDDYSVWVTVALCDPLTSKVANSVISCKKVEEILCCISEKLRNHLCSRALNSTLDWHQTNVC